MACKFSTLTWGRVLALAACFIAAIASAVPPAASSPPDASNGCGAQPRLPAGNYSETDWPILQTGTNRQSVGRIFNVHVPRQHERPQAAPLAIVINLHGQRWQWCGA